MAIYLAKDKKAEAKKLRDSSWATNHRFNGVNHNKSLTSMNNNVDGGLCVIGVPLYSRAAPMTNTLLDNKDTNE